MAVAKSAASAVKTDSASSAAHIEAASGITVGASDTFLLFVVEADTSTPGTISAHWDNGGTAQAMTLLGSITDAAGATAMTLAVFGLVNPTPGAKKFDWTFSGQSAAVNSYHFSISFTGTATASVAAATEGFQTNSGSAANAAVTSAAAIPSGDMAVAAYNNINGYSNAFTSGTNPGDGGTAVGKNETLTTNMAGEYYSGAGSTVAASATQGASGEFVAAIVGIKAPAAAATTTVGMPRGGRLFAPRSGPTRGLRQTQAFPTGTVYSDSVTEAATAADAVSAVAVFAASDTEAGTATDTLSAAAIFAASVSEAGAATDTPSAVATFAASVTEAASATDTVTSGQIFTADLTEAATATDADSTTAIFAAADAEAATAADAPTATAVFGAAVTEAGAASDAPAAVATFAAALSEAGTATDATDGTTQTVYNVSITEAANATDSLDGDGGTPLRLGGGPALWYEPKPRKPHKRTLDDILAEIIERADEKKSAIPQAAAAVTDEVIEDGELDELREEIARTLKERRKRGDSRRLKIVAAIAAQRAIRRRIEDDEEAAILLLH